MYIRINVFVSLLGFLKNLKKFREKICKNDEHNFTKDQQGKLREGNTEEKNNGNVVFKWNIHGSAGK
jgi:hypothetical protein